jgi:hypothetical protein
VEALSPHRVTAVGKLLTLNCLGGSKKHLSSQHAIHCVRSVVDSFVANQSNVNICALICPKLLTLVIMFALFMKLMDRQVPATLLNIFETWYGASIT